MITLRSQVLGVPFQLETKCDTMEEAINKAKNGLAGGFLRTETVTMMLGPGSIIVLLGDTSTPKTLDLPNEDEFVVFVQLGRSALPPFKHPTKESAQEAVDKLLVDSYLQYTFDSDNDVMFAKLAPGMVIYVLSGSDFLKQHRESQYQAARQPQGRSPGGIILPGR